VEQVTNGVAVRMAVLYLLLSGSDPDQPLDEVETTTVERAEEGTRRARPT
jgi:hypothetical protein